MMVSIDSAAVAPAPAPRTNGRSAGPGPNKFDEVLDGVPMPDNEAPANSGSTTRSDDDSTSADSRRKPRHAADDPAPGVVPPAVVAVVAVDPARTALSVAAAVNDASAADLGEAADGAALPPGAGVAAAAAGSLPGTDPASLVAPPADAAAQALATLPLQAASPLAVDVTDATDGTAAAQTAALAATAAAAAKAENTDLPTGDDVVVGAQADTHAGNPTDAPADAGPPSSPAAGVGPAAPPPAVAAPSVPAPIAAAGTEPRAATDHAAPPVTADPLPTDALAAGTVPAQAAPNGGPTQARAAAAIALGVAQQATTEADAAEPPSATGRAKRVLPTSTPAGERPTAPTGPLTNGQAPSRLAVALDHAAAPSAVAAALPAEPAPVTVTSAQVGAMHVDVDLSGEGLGPLRLRARSVGSDIHVALSATDPHLRAALLDNAHDLRRDLHSSGLELASYDVNSSPDQNPGAGAEDGARARSGQHPAAETAPSDTGARGTSTGRVRQVNDSIQHGGAPSRAGLDLRL